jgi:hypothetical protein
MAKSEERTDETTADVREMFGFVVKVASDFGL